METAIGSLVLCDLLFSGGVLLIAAVRVCSSAAAPHSPDVLQWMALMNNNPTRGARVVLLQILHKAASADCRHTANTNGFNAITVS